MTGIRKLSAREFQQKEEEEASLGVTHIPQMTSSPRPHSQTYWNHWGKDHKTMNFKKLPMGCPYSHARIESREEYMDN